MKFLGLIGKLSLLYTFNHLDYHCTHLIHITPSVRALSSHSKRLANLTIITSTTVCCVTTIFKVMQHANITELEVSLGI